MVSQSKIDQLQSSDNAVQKLQAAFLHYCKLNLVSRHVFKHEILSFYSLLQRIKIGTVLIQYVVNKTCHGSDFLFKVLFVCEVILHQSTAASTWWCGPRPRLGWVEMAVGLPEGPSYPGHSPLFFRNTAP